MGKIVKYFCDRCDKELDNLKDRSNVNAYNVSTHKDECNMRLPEHKTYDLCEECYKKCEVLLKDFMLGKNIMLTTGEDT